MKSHLTVIALTSILICGYSCTNGNMFGIRGEGPVVERKLELSTIKGISVPGSAKVYLTKGPIQSITVEGQENLIENLDRDVTGEIWKIDYKLPVWQSKSLKIRITMSDLRSVKVSGSGDVETTNRFTGANDLEIKISGSGTARIDVEAGDVTADVSGSGNIQLEGSARYLDLGVTGSGSIDAYRLKSSRADIRISGSGDVQVDADNTIDAHISGSGSVYYKGNPKVNSSVSGSGTIRSR